ncbi:hypothetical protein BpHYR1_006759 [Brachionus plicatilis]|uniref:Uncharacterized protein n=1 Tax=Brachionus plicatilis TaxID=10195 RepID=A0A3M7SGW5_BRAPC|nr:hypothetical protein BpHYR1_006759 [Brachionus plicatilis]
MPKKLMNSFVNKRPMLNFATFKLSIFNNINLIKQKIGLLSEKSGGVVVLDIDSFERTIRYKPSFIQITTACAFLDFGGHVRFSVLIGLHGMGTSLLINLIVSFNKRVFFILQKSVKSKLIFPRVGQNLGLDFHFNNLNLNLAAKKTSWNGNPSVRIIIRNETQT